jgi:branched-chain amino acid transport system permease protein
MLQYIVIGVVVGAIYALAASGLIVTYRASGILNFGFGGIAYFIARTYYFFNTQHGWPIVSSAILSLIIIAPALGAALYLFIFRNLQNSSTLVKVISTIGVGVAFPPLSYLLYGNPFISSAPGLAPLPVSSYIVFGVAITMNQIIVMACVVTLFVTGALIVRFTEWGLMARALVDSPAMTLLSGINPTFISLAVWSVTTFMAGLAGVLVAPLVGLDSQSYSILIAAAFTVVLIARLTNLPRAILAALAIGIVTSVLEDYLPPTSAISAGILASVPFGFILIFLLYEMRRGSVAEGLVLGGSLDRAISSPSGSSAGSHGGVIGELTRLHFSNSGRHVLRSERTISAITVVLFIALIQFTLPNFWVGLCAEGVCFGVIFLAFTLVTGEGGMIWLCQAAFAGIGASLAAYFWQTHHWSPIICILVAALIVAPGGVLIGFLTTRLGDLYVALATLAFGILVDQLVLALPVFSGDSDNGLVIGRPTFATSNMELFFSALVVFCIFAIVVEHYRRSTAGLGMTAVRDSETAARTVGMSPVQMKVMISGLAAFIAAIGGGCLAVCYGVALPTDFNTIGALVWLAVLVTIGIGTNIAALVAGIFFTVIPGLFQTYLPLSLSQVPLALFGLGAILVARNPDGTVAMHSRQLRYLLQKVGRFANKSTTSDHQMEPGEPLGSDKGPLVAKGATRV